MKNLMPNHDFRTTVKNGHAQLHFTVDIPTAKKITRAVQKAVALKFLCWSPSNVSELIEKIAKPIIEKKIKTHLKSVFEIETMRTLPDSEYFRAELRSAIIAYLERFNIRSLVKTLNSTGKK